MKSIKKIFLVTHGDILNKRNLLAYTYFRAGQIDKARDELLSIIQETDSCTAWKQLIHLEKSQGKLDDAQDYANYCISKYPESITVREQLISIAKAKGQKYEVVAQLKEIINMYPESLKNIERIEMINKYEGR